MAGTSALSVLNTSRPDALARRVIGAARELTGDTVSAARRSVTKEGFKDMVRGLDANADGRINGADAVRLAGRGAAKIGAVLTGVEVDTSGGASVARTLARQAAEAAEHGRAPNPRKDRPEPPRPLHAPPTIEGLHALYAELRALR